MKIAVASEILVDEYRRELVSFLEQMAGVNLLDANVMTNWRDEEDLVRNCVEMVLSRSVDFVALASVSGSGLSMKANKHDGIRSAVLPNSEYIVEAVELGANMCEVSSALCSPEESAHLFLRFNDALKNNYDAN